MFLEEQVTNQEGEEFARKIGAAFKLTSAATNDGVVELFKEVGKRYLDPNYRDLKKKEGEELENKSRSKSLKLNKSKAEKKNKKGGWC